MDAIIDKWAVHDAVLWEPHVGQLEVAECPIRNRVVSAGRRWGKSDLGGHELLPEFFLTNSMVAELRSRGQRREFWIIGPEYSDSEKEFRVIYNLMKRLGVPFDKPGTYYNPVQGNLHISALDGLFQIHGKSAKYPDQLVGEGLSGAILAEAAKLKPIVWDKYIRPTLADFDGWALMTSTPEGRNWFYEMWKRGQDTARSNWQSWRMPAWVNHYVYKRRITNTRHVKELRELLKNRVHQGIPIKELADSFQLVIDDEVLSEIEDLTDEAFAQEIGAEFNTYTGRVFPTFDEETHVGDLKYNPDWMTFGAVDYGFTNPNVWLLIQVSPWGLINVLDEVYKSGLTDDEFAEEILARGLAPRSITMFYPDPEAPGSTKVLQRMLKLPFGGNTGGRRKDRIDAIRMALKPNLPHLPLDHPERRPLLMFDRRCVNAIREHGAYRYPRTNEERENEEPEEPLKKASHCPEALGRFFKGYFGTMSDGPPRTWVSRVRFRR